MRAPLFAQKGVSRLEVAVVVAIVALLYVWILHTLNFYQELTEKTVVESSVINIRSALQMKIADMILSGEGARQNTLAKTNPVLLLQSPPRGYLGEMRRPKNLPAGSWYYEPNKAELVYIPNLTANLQMSGGGAPAEASPLALRWQIRLVSAGEAGLVTVDIELLTPYEWF
jgi:hypothetical protein